MQRIAEEVKRGQPRDGLKSILYLVAGVLGLLGLMFIAGNKGLPMRIVVGVLMVGAAGALVWLTRAKVPERTIVQKVDLSGDVQTEQMKCKQCGAPLDDKSVQLREGAIFVKCPYCGTSYQIEEAPKW